LARSGVGGLTLVDLDDVCITNTNRQVHAVTGNVGRPKIEAMRERVLAILRAAMCGWNIGGSTTRLPATS
ncbi:MAG: hypothetical protein HC898_04070, partial [Phycisphaerales bacterium]|nr:hypothetical protein [Phycisphaerales bacterium]